MVDYPVGHLNETCFSIGSYQVPGVSASERERARGRKRVVGGADGDAPSRNSAVSAVYSADCMSDPVSEEHRTVERDHGFPKPFRTVQQGHYECDAEAAR